MKKLLILALLALSACCYRGSDDDFSEVSSKILDSFRGENRKLTIDFKGDHTAFGTNHGKVPDWYRICGINVDLVNRMAGSLSSISFDFKKGSNDLKVTVSCSNLDEKGGVTAKSYNFKYRGKADENNLRIGIDLNNEKAEGRWDKDRRGNLLEFFSHASWLYLKNENEIIGISQLAKNGYGEKDAKIIPMATRSDFIEARYYMADAKGKDKQSTADAYDIADGVPGILLVLTADK